ncbi:Uncharacterised protein [Streptococcus pneumoniae]|nr:Uncharacterised protein [Streptococcus pneumoniae]CIW22636.1 Uncharacterised protein [Streptococcus pneumoniae]
MGSVNAIQKCMLLVACWNVVFVVQYYLEEVGTAVQIIAKLCGTVLHR